MNKEEWINITCTIQTSKGELLISGVTSPDILEKLEIDQQLKAFRPAAKQKKPLLRSAVFHREKSSQPKSMGSWSAILRFIRRMNLNGGHPDKTKFWSSERLKCLRATAIMG